MSASNTVLAEFLKARSKFAAWPSNVLSTDQFEHELEGYREDLECQQSNLFDPRIRKLYFLDYLKDKKGKSIQTIRHLIHGVQRLWD
jgi:hypothetical protein